VNFDEMERKREKRAWPRTGRVEGVKRGWGGERVGQYCVIIMYKKKNLRK
jgi:hypothetical protein